MAVDPTNNKASETKLETEPSAPVTTSQLPVARDVAKSATTPFYNPHVRPALSVQGSASPEALIQPSRGVPIQTAASPHGPDGVPYTMGNHMGMSLGAGPNPYALSQRDYLMYFGYMQPPHPYQQHGVHNLNVGPRHLSGLGDYINHPGSFMGGIPPVNLACVPSHGQLFSNQEHVPASHPRVTHVYQHGNHFNNPTMTRGDSLAPGDSEAERAATSATDKSKVGRTGRKKKGSGRKAKAMAMDDNETDLQASSSPLAADAAIQLSFSNRDEAVAAMKVPDWNPPSPDGTIPNTDEQRQGWVRKLVAAFLDITQSKDKNGPVLRNRWFDKDEPEKGYKDFYNREEMEKLCWDILDVTEQLHRNGPSTFTSLYDPHFELAIKKTHNLTFEQRMKGLIKLFSHYKARCDKVFKGSVIETFVADPITMIGTAAMNRDANDNRQDWIQTGRTQAHAASTPLHGAPDDTTDAITRFWLENPDAVEERSYLAQLGRGNRDFEGDADDGFPLSGTPFARPAKRKTAEHRAGDKNHEKPPKKRLQNTSSELSSVPSSDKPPSSDKSSELSDPPSSAQLKAPSPYTRAT